MSDLKQILLLLLAALPYVLLLLFVLIGKKTREFRFSDVLMGCFGILIALGAGVIGGFAIITNYPDKAVRVRDEFERTFAQV